MTVPVIEAADVTQSGTNTNATTFAVSHPAYVSGDLLIMFCYVDRNGTLTPPTAGANSETLINSTTGIGGGVEGPTVGLITWVGDATVSASTMNWTNSLSEGFVGMCIKVLAGEFDSTTPIDSVSGFSGAESGTDAPTPAWTGTAANGRVVVATGIDLDPFNSAATAWTLTKTSDIGQVSGTITTRDAGTTASESIASVNHQITNGDSSTSLGIVVNEPAVAGGGAPLFVHHINQMAGN